MRQSDLQAMGKKIEAACVARNWAEAIQLTQQLLKVMPRTDYRVTYHQGNLAECLLYSGNLEEAKALYFRLWSDKRSYKQESSAYGLARVAAERGDFISAMHWLGCVDRSFSRCGNCYASRKQHTYVLRTVWGAAQQSNFETPLRQIISGRFRPLPLRLASGSEKAQSRLARLEAQLILAEQLARQGKSAQSRPLLSAVLQTAAKGSPTFALAEAHLKQIT